MKLLTIHNSMKSLQKFLTKDIDGNHARTIAKVIQDVQNDYIPYQIGRQKIFAKYGKQAGELTVIPQDSEGMKELNAYDEAEIDFEVKEKIPGKEFDSCKEISANDFLLCSWLIELSDPEPKKSKGK